MSLIINPGMTIGPGVSLIVPLSSPNGLTAGTASSSAWQIKQDYPASTDGLYWIKNANINGGTAFQIYADMTTQGGGWTLIMLNNADNTVGGTWDFANCLLRNELTPPTSPNDRPRGTSSTTDLYSIIGWADYIKRSSSGFDYMFDAFDRGYNGGIWTANEAYSFVDQHPIGVTMGDEQYQTAGWRKNITEITRFLAGSNNVADSATWNYDAGGVEARMPWYGKFIGDAPEANSYDANAGQGLITTNGQDGGWWGTLLTPGGWNPSPWISSGVTGTINSGMSTGSPGIIWYWVR